MLARGYVVAGLVGQVVAAFVGLGRVAGAVSLALASLLLIVGGVVKVAAENGSPDGSA